MCRFRRPVALPENMIGVGKRVLAPRASEGRVALDLISIRLIFEALPEKSWAYESTNGTDPVVPVSEGCIEGSFAALCRVRHTFAVQWHPSYQWQARRYTEMLSKIL